jgi:hypothetical protein
VIEPEREFCTLHTAEWWKAHWAKSGRVVVESADAVVDGWKDWLRWLEFIVPKMEPGEFKDAYEREIDLLRVECGKPSED